jgi:CubicO group peptidase (beta-lactamase class C family)
MIGRSIRISRCRRFIAAMVMLWPYPLAAADSAPPATASEIDAHIERVVTGLLPPVVIADAPAVASKLPDRMRDLHIPGVSIAVIHDGALQWARGFGVTAMAGPPVTTDTLFQAGSISKSLSAVTTLALVQAGRLDLDSDVNQYLKSWKVPSNTFTAEAKVTLRELLSHTAGTTVHGFDGYRAGDPIPTLVEVLDGTPPANSAPVIVDLKPATQFRYSGGGYTIVQQLLIDVTGEPFPDLVDDTVLRPFGMSHSSFRPPAAGMAATPYLNTGEPVPGGAHLYPELAAAGLWTTPSDLARFALALQDALAGRRNPVLSRETAHEMLTARLGDYGLGFDLGGSPQHRSFGHSGVDAGFESVMIAYEVGDGAVVMTNGVGGTLLMNEVIRSISNEYHWPDFHPVSRKRVAIDSGILDRYVGTYELTPDFAIRISRDGNHLYAEAPRQRRTEIFPENDQRFFATTVDAEITFDMEGQSQATRLILHLDDEDHPAKRLP